VLAAACLVTGVAVAVLLLAEWRDDQRLRWFSKPVASAAFVALGLSLPGAATPYGRAILAALVLSFLGDVLLIPRAQNAFRAGVLAFGLGHLAFVAAFVLHGLRAGIVATALVPLALVATFVGRLLLPHVPTELRSAVLGYIVVITAMLACAIGTRDAQIAGGALAFYLSDLSVARDRFVQPTFWNRAWGLPLYYGAQLTLAATLAR
jgi:uncharacterized membrane protein YhhN